MRIPDIYEKDFWRGTWMDFALSFDGYAYAGGEGMTNLLNLYEPVVSHFMETKKLPSELTLSEL